MMRRHDAVLVVLLTIAGLGIGCSDNPVGRICDLGTDPPGDKDFVITSPSLDCVSRTCLRAKPTGVLPPGGRAQPANSGLCTAECSSDDDCDRVPESPCVTGFTCGVAVPVGSFCCRKLCICRDYIAVPTSGVLPTPAACDPGNDNNKCCNLPGRDACNGS